MITLREIHLKNKGRLVWLEQLASNDGRLILRNEIEILHTYMAAEFDPVEQAEAARYCAVLNTFRHIYSEAQVKLLV